MQTDEPTEEPEFDPALEDPPLDHDLQPIKNYNEDRDER